MTFVFAFAVASALLQISPAVPDTPNRQPHLAVSGQQVALTYASGGTIWFASSSDAGRTLTKSVKVAESPGVALGRHRGPKITFAGDSIVITAILSKLGRGLDGELVSWRSADGGKTWAGPVQISSVPKAAREGLHGMAARGKDVFVTWLDLRTDKMTLYGAVSKDGGLSWGTDFRIYDSPDGHICECCHPSALIANNGDMHVMWRNWLGGSRDMWTAASRDGGKTWQSSKLGQGTWKLNACPMDGGGFAFDAKGNLQTVWRRDKAIFATKPGAPETEIAIGKDPAMTVAADGMWVAWSAPDGSLAYSSPSGVAPLAPKGAFPALAGSEFVVAAWESDGSIFVQRLQK